MRVLRKRRAPATGGSCDRAGDSEDWSFAITINGRNTMGVVAVDLERGAPVWNLIAGTGLFTGFFITTL
jgi:hypothetical protein